MEQKQNKVEVIDLCKSFGDLKVLENCNFQIGRASSSAL